MLSAEKEAGQQQLSSTELADSAFHVLQVPGEQVQQVAPSLDAASTASTADAQKRLEEAAEAHHEARTKAQDKAHVEV